MMNEKLNINTCITAMESLFSNGSVECHNLIATEGKKKQQKTKKQNKKKTHTHITRWEVWTRNSSGLGY